jgi:hypothetical protein
MTGIGPIDVISSASVSRASSVHFVHRPVPYVLGVVLDHGSIRRSTRSSVPSPAYRTRVLYRGELGYLIELATLVLDVQVASISEFSSIG